MFDYSKLKGKIKEVFDTQTAFAVAVGRTEAFISNVLNGKSFLDQKDIELWAEVLSIPDEEIGFYFFTRKVHETELEAT